MAKVIHQPACEGRFHDFDYCANGQTVLFMKGAAQAFLDEVSKEIEVGPNCGLVLRTRLITPTGEKILPEFYLSVKGIGYFEFKIGFRVDATKAEVFEQSQFDLLNHREMISTVSQVISKIEKFEKLLTFFTVNGGEE